MTPNFICIEGNIGAGKTTFSKAYAEHVGADLILEQFAENPFLASFYQEPQKNAFPLEMSFLAERYQQLSKTFAQPDLFKQRYIADYHFDKTLLFAELNLKAEEFYIFKSFFHALKEKLTQPIAIVYLHTETPLLLENIKQRGRSFEQKIGPEYLESVAKLYKKRYFGYQNNRVIIVNYPKERWIKTTELIHNLEDIIHSKKPLSATKPILI